MSSQAFYEVGRSVDQVPITDQLTRVQTASGTVRTMVEAARAIDKQTNVQSVLKSLHQLLSAVIHFDSIGIGLLANHGNSLHLMAFERGTGGPQLEIGTEIPYIGTAAGRAIEEQRTIHVPDVRQEILKIPMVASQASTIGVRSAYMFPLSTPKRKLGVLSFGKSSEGEATPDELAVMEAVAAHVATALDSAIASDVAESYQKELAGERDRYG